jgi:hypothetical protein
MNLRLNSWLVLLVGLVLACLVYWPGLHGGFLFDDFPNIVDNEGVHLTSATIPDLARATLSSPASEFKRPMASLSFALNYLASGLEPFPMKLTNLLFHLINGILVFLVTRRLIPLANRSARTARYDIAAAVVATAWMLLPINLTSVLYVVQRMESMANVFVLAGLLGYIAGRQRMQEGRKGFAIVMVSVALGTVAGCLAKETAIMLPLYAFVVECFVFRFDRTTGQNGYDWRIAGTFIVVLVIPLIIGLVWLAPGLMHAGTWSTRDFGLASRLLSETRIVSGYIRWTLLPALGGLSFYHDDFLPSRGWLSPPTTLVCTIFLAILAGTAVWLRTRLPLVGLGIALYLACHLLTGTVLTLELIYEHRNYFASFGLMLAVVPLLCTPVRFDGKNFDSMPMARYVLLGALLVSWGAETFFTSHAWSTPLDLSRELASRGPNSPRAQYELGRTYIIYSHYDPQSPFVALTYPVLERAAALPNSSILPEQALIFMNARMHLPLRDNWWTSMTAKLQARSPTVQDDSSLLALVVCVRDGNCDLPENRMVAAFNAAIGHPTHSARVAAGFSDYLWNITEDQPRAIEMARDAVDRGSSEPAYRATLARMLLQSNDLSGAEEQIKALEKLNIAGSENELVKEVRKEWQAAASGHPAKQPSDTDQ